MRWEPNPPTQCGCPCHRYSRVCEPSVDVRDPVHAALACDECRNIHAPALLDVQPEIQPPSPAPFCWEPESE